MKRPHLILLLLAACLLPLILPPAHLLKAQARRTTEGPGAALKHYLRAVYARDYTTAYGWISAEDRKAKSQEEYLRENPSFSGAALDLTRSLAALIEFRNLRSEIGKNGATVTFTVRMPDANAPSLQSLLREFDPDRLAQLSENEKRAIKDQLESMSKQGTLPMIEGEERWSLVKEAGGWRVLLDWGSAIRVRFAAKVMEGLPWLFRPVQDVVLATPGETLQAFYRVRNLSAKPVTAKAKHIDEPKALASKYLEIIQCFCFIQQTLAPGEERDLPLVFRIRWDVPDKVREFRVTYEFYPINKFPEK